MYRIETKWYSSLVLSCFSRIEFYRNALHLQFSWCLNIISAFYRIYLQNLSFIPWLCSSQRPVFLIVKTNIRMNSEFSFIAEDISERINKRLWILNEIHNIKCISVMACHVKRWYDLTHSDDVINCWYRRIPSFVHAECTMV